MNKKIYVSAGVVILVGVGTGLTLWKQKSRSVPAPVSAEKGTSYFEERGEALYKRKILAPQIAAYEKMREAYPDSVDLKKKLALAYFDAGEYAKAEPLLETVAKTNLSDDQVLKALEVIHKKK